MTEQNKRTTAELAHEVGQLALAKLREKIEGDDRLRAALEAEGLTVDEAMEIIRLRPGSKAGRRIQKVLDQADRRKRG